MDFAPHTERDVETMLATIGAASVDDLFAVIPPSLRLGGLPIPDGHAEAEVLREMAALAAQNRSADDLVCFMGAGAYDHHVPSMVWAVLSRGELATSYTPYQPELSQGVLQTLFEYQTMICELTGLDISNAGLYDGGSALAEAVNLAVGATKRTRVVVAGAVNPLYAGVLTTQGAGLGLDIRATGWGSDGRAHDVNAEGAAAVVVQHPNLFGVLEDIPALAEIAHAAGAKLKGCRSWGSSASRAPTTPAIVSSNTPARKRCSKRRRSSRSSPSVCLRTRPRSASTRRARGSSQACRCLA